MYTILLFKNQLKNLSEPTLRTEQQDGCLFKNVSDVKIRKECLNSLFIEVVRFYVMVENAEPVR